jgi:hypothetical protein
MLLDTGNNNDAAPQTEVIEETEAVQGTFEELAKENYLVQSVSDELYEMQINYMLDSHYKKLYTADLSIINNFLEKLDAIELTEHNGDLNYSANEEFHIQFMSSKTSEKLIVNLYGDYMIISNLILHVNEDKEKKIIHYTTEIETQRYKITGNNLEDGYLEELFDTLDELK